MEKQEAPPSSFAVCHALRELREDLGLSQKELAERLNVPASYISRWEVSRVPGLEDLWLIETVGLRQQPGTLLRAAGFIGADPAAGGTVRDRLASDPRLRGKAKTVVLAAYDAATA